jgi:hypothetical protein
VSAQVKQAEFQKNDKFVVTKADAPKAMGNDKKSKADLFAKRKLQEKLAFGWIEKQDDGSGQRIMILQHMFDAAEFRGQAAVVRFPYVTAAGAVHGCAALGCGGADSAGQTDQTVRKTAMLWLHPSVQTRNRHWIEYRCCAALCEPLQAFWLRQRSLAAFARLFSSKSSRQTSKQSVRSSASSRR